MAIEEIVRAMEAEGTAECEAILAEARAKAERILAEARDEVEAKRRRLVEAEMGTLRAEQARRLNEARLAGQKRLSTERHRLIAAAFEEAEAQLARLRRSSGYRDMLRALLAEAVAELGPSRLIVRTDPADANLATELVGELGLSASVEPTLSCIGGLDLCDAEGRIVVHNTFESRLRQAHEVRWDEISAEIEAGAARGG